jgi:predicted nuclease with TOPRIM domain
MMNNTVFTLQDIDQIEPTFKENQELTAEICRLREKLEATEKEKAELETSRHNAVIELNQKEHERTCKLSSRNSPSMKSVVNTYSCTDQHICSHGE